MSTFINVVVTETYDDGGAPNATRYKVEADVQLSGQIPRELFVVDLDGVFAHVALVDDVRLYPLSREQALTEEKGFYRVRTVTRAFATKEGGATFSADVKRRLMLVVKDWDADAEVSFGGTESLVYSSDDET